MRGEAVRGRGPKIYQVGLSGKEVHETLRMLETRAIKDENYTDVRACVFLAERIKHEARRQGFGSDIEPEEMRVFLPDGLPEGL